MRGLVNASTGIPYTNDVIYPTNQDQTIPKNILLVNGLTIKSYFSKLPIGTYQCQSGVWNSSTSSGENIVNIKNINIGGIPTNIGIENFKTNDIISSGFNPSLSIETVIVSKSEVKIRILASGVYAQNITQLKWFIARKIK